MGYETMEQLAELRLTPMKNEYQRQCELPACQELSFNDRFAQSVTTQTNNRHEARLKRLVKKACLSDPTALLSDIDYDPARGIKIGNIESLSTWYRKNLCPVFFRACRMHARDERPQLPDTAPAD